MFLKIFKKQFYGMNKFKWTRLYSGIFNQPQYLQEHAMFKPFKRLLLTWFKLSIELFRKMKGTRKVGMSLLVCVPFLVIWSISRNKNNKKIALQKPLLKTLKNWRKIILFIIHEIIVLLKTRSKSKHTMYFMYHYGRHWCSYLKTLS